MNFNKAEIQLLNQIKNIYKQKLIDLVIDSIGDNRRKQKLENVTTTVDSLMANTLDRYRLSIIEKSILRDIFYILDTKLNTNYIKNNTYNLF